MLVNLLFSFIGVGAIVGIVLLVDLFYKRMIIPIKMVNAGSTDGHIPSDSTTSTFISPFDSFYHKGRKVNPKNYIIRKVDGDCMVTRGISAGDLVFIKEYNNDINTLNIGDILFIRYEKDGKEWFKLREYRGLLETDNQQIQTLYYTREGKGKKSSLPHNITNVKGVVEIRFAS